MYDNSFVLTQVNYKRKYPYWETSCLLFAFNISTIQQLVYFNLTKKVKYKIILLYIITYNNINIIINIFVILCILPIVELLKCWKLIKTRTTYWGNKRLLMKNRKILIPNKWLLFTEHPVPSKSLPILIRQFHGDIAIGPFFAIDIEFGVTMGKEE